MLAIIEILFEALRLVTFQPIRNSPRTHPLSPARDKGSPAEHHLRTQTEVPAARS